MQFILTGLALPINGKMSWLSSLTSFKHIAPGFRQLGGATQEAVQQYGKRGIWGNGVSMRVVLCGYYGMGNGGDEALLAALLQMLPPHVTPVVLSGNPEATTRDHGVEAHPRKSLAGLWKAFKGAQGFIWGGGSLMQDATSAMNPLYYGGLMLWAQLRGLKTVAWAQGIGPLQRSWARRLAYKTYHQCTGVTVRDRASAAQASNWGVRAGLSPDPVWALSSTPILVLADFPAPRVAVSLRSHPWLTAERLAQFGQALANFQTATGVSILLVPFQVSKDQSIAEAIAPQLPGPQQILTLTDPRQLKGVFRGVEMAIAMRLHALIMAAAEGCRCFALSYDPKVAYLAEDLTMPGWEMAPPAEWSSSPDFALEPWPETVAAMTQAWLQHYANGVPASPDQIQSRVDRALIHQEMLHRFLA
jgi:polysaccharide pyruvyl transferase CsaB